MLIMDRIEDRIKTAMPYLAYITIVAVMALGIYKFAVKQQGEASKYLLHNSAIVTAIEQIDEKWCVYSLSQKNEEDIGVVVFKMKSVCGLYQVPDELIFSKNYKNRGK